MKNKKYKYNIGEVVNNSIVLELITHKDSRGHNVKAYIMQCMETEGIYEVKQFNLSQGYKSPYLSGHKVNKYNWLYNEKSVLPYLKNEEDAKKVTKKTDKKILCVCPKCKREKKSNVRNLVRFGFVCHYCSSHKSYPEIFVQSYLEYFDIEYITQYKMGNKRRYFDFYLPKYNTIIETHGEQHYNSDIAWGVDAYTKSNISDKEKREYCIEKGINLIEVDCSKSEFAFIKESLNNSVGKYLFTISSADEQKIKTIIYNNKLTDRDIKIVQYYDDGYSINKIKEKLNIGSGTANKVLKKYGRYISLKPDKKVRCLNSGKVYKSMAEASRDTGANPSQIRRACLDKNRYAGKINGKDGKWEFIK